MTDFAGTDGAFDDISSITVAYEGKTFTVSDEAAVKSATDALKKIRIHKSPIDGSTPENRPSYLTVCINHGNGADTLFCFGKDLAECMSADTSRSPTRIGWFHQKRWKNSSTPCGL